MPRTEAAISLKGSKVAVTGGAGVVGSHIVDEVIAGGADEVVVLDKLVRGRLSNLDDAMATGRLRFVDADIRDREAVSEAVREVDVLFHQAALRVTLCAQEPRLALEVMGDGTFNVLEAAVKRGVRKVVAASSASVYGAAEQIPTPEEHHPYNDRTLYGVLKAFNEGLLRSFHEMYGLDYVVLRYFNVYGPRMDIYGPHTEVMVRWMELIEAGQPPLILGDGTQTMDFVYVGDVARANVLAASSAVSGEVFNVGSGVETSLNDLAVALAGVMGSDVRPDYGPERSVNPVGRRLAETSKAERMLGFRTEVALKEGLRRLTDWWRGERARAKEVEGVAKPR